MKPKLTRFTAAQRGIIDPKNRPVQGATRWTVPGLVKFLQSVKKNAEARDPDGRGALVASWADEAIENVNREDYLKEKGEIAIAAARGDAEAAEMLSAAVQIVTTNVVTANTCWLAYFEKRSLGPEDYMVIEPDVHGQAIAIDAIGQDGGRSMVQSQPDDPTPLFVPIHMRGTPWIEYPQIDLYKGQVKSAALLQFDLARDRAYREDVLASSYFLVNSADTRHVASFTTTGPLHLRDFKLHPGVVAANLPAGNYVELSGNTTTSSIRKELFDAIIEYATSWGENTLEAGSFMPVEIIVSSKHKTDFLKQVNLTSEGNMLVNQVFETGFILNYAGYKWIINGVNTIAPTHGVAYVRFDQPVGVWGDKPSVASEIEDETPALRAQNKGRMCATWAESIALPLHWRKRSLAVRFRTAS